MVATCPECGVEVKPTMPIPDDAVWVGLRCYACGHDFVHTRDIKIRERTNKGVLDWLRRHSFTDGEIQPASYLHDGPLSDTTIDEVLR